MAAKPLASIIAALSLLLGVAHAQNDSDQPQSDPPDRAARLAYLKGDVSMQPAGEDEWAAALLNRPLTTGDKLWTERGARAEIQVGQAAIRLDGDTGFSFLDLGDDTVQMRMTAGTMILDVRELQDREQIEIDTPNIALAILRPGSYRIEVNDAGDATTVKIGKGEAEANGPSTNTLVHAGQAVTFRGVDQLVADTSTLGSADDFDNWSMSRERRDDRVATSRTSQYVSRDVTGYDDLDEYGSWSSEPEYGYVWTPTRVVVGWSPYRFGRWVWVSPWGWSWVDDSPWGYAPFHYGRWAQVRNRWCWVPGPRHVRAVYAPALVGWVGSRGNYVSWVPLGPRDVYRPGHRFSRHYWERVNFANARNVDRTHVREVFDRRGGPDNFNNRSIPDGVTAVPRASFAGAQRVGDRRVRFNEREMAGHDGNGDNRPGPRVAPVRESRLGGVARTNPRIPAAIAARQVIVKREPPAASQRYTRRAPDRNESWQTQSDRGTRMPQPRPRDGNQDVSPRGRDINGNVQTNPQADRQNSRDNYGRRERPIDRQDRPASDPGPDTAPPVRLSPAEQRSQPERSQPERSRDDRPDQQQRERFQQQREEAERRHREQSNDNRDSQYSQYSQRPQRTQDAVREAMARQRERESQQAPREREIERARPEPRELRQESRREQPRMEQPREQRREQPREQSRPEPRQERSQPPPQPRQERQSPAEQRSSRQGDGNRPDKR